CEFTCEESIEEGYLVLRWQSATRFSGYIHRLGEPSVPPPAPPFLVEWRFLSNHPFVANPLCDADLLVDYRAIVDELLMFGDTVISFDGGDVLLNLANSEFRTYRFESHDGVSYCFYVDGTELTCGSKTGGDEYHSIRISGKGGCDLDLLPTVNKWDFVRYGTISAGEKLVGSDPPAGFVDARTHATLDRFTITYDEPNYVLVDEISVETTGTTLPAVLKTRRLNNGEPDTVEIVLDRPIPFDATTSFTFDDGTAVNSVTFVYAPGDTNGSGTADLADFAAFQNCFGVEELLGACLPLDADSDQQLSLDDYFEFQSVLDGP
ncbi:MAG: hypothetical protein IID35_10395, partial [Planctomycetes bacterium]|nr:hypothetical protein [Planctomycetota bacterium]